MYKLIILIVTAITLTGCADLRYRASLMTADSQFLPGCDDLLGMYENYSHLNSDQRKQELSTATEAWSVTQSGCKQLRLALLLSHPDNPVDDRNRALKLLTALLEEDKDMPFQARQLAALLKDRLELEQSLQLHIKKLTHDLKLEHTASKAQLKELSDMQSQLQKLKNIEESINEKEQAIIAPATNNAASKPVQNSTGR